MKIKVLGKAHFEGTSKRTGNSYSFNQIHYLGKARNVEGDAACTLNVDPAILPIGNISVGSTYDFEFGPGGYVVAVNKVG